MSRSILVVDDAAFMRRLLRDLFVEAGYQVHEAVSGEDAVEKYAESRPDLVTMDLGMPGMSGLDALERIRACDEGARVVVVSAQGADETIDRAMTLGACAYVRKPFQPAMVLDTVRTALLVPPGARC
jgi:two-component system chemotaxis response regulator CheY